MEPSWNSNRAICFIGPLLYLIIISCTTSESGITKVQVQDSTMNYDTLEIYEFDGYMLVDLPKLIHNDLYSDGGEIFGMISRDTLSEPKGTFWIQGTGISIIYDSNIIDHFEVTSESDIYEKLKPLFKEKLKTLDSSSCVNIKLSDSIYNNFQDEFIYKLKIDKSGVGVITLQYQLDIFR